ncbi:MAG: protease pro-enzyme activation domain-containing protein, partial [Stenotrophobium sp.]
MRNHSFTWLKPVLARVRRYSGAALALPLFLSAYSASAPGAANPQAADLAGTWAATATQGVIPKNGILLGPLSADTPMHIGLGLRLRNIDQLKQQIFAVNTPGSPAYGQYLTSDQFIATYAPDPDRVQVVVNYLAAQGFRNISLVPSRLFVSADGTAGMVQQAFDTSLNNYVRNGQTLFTNATPAQVPAALGDVVLSVIGLQS